MIRLKEKYQKEVIPTLLKKEEYKNVMQLPKIEKVVVNTGFGREVTSKTSGERNKFLKNVLGDVAAICGQKPVLTKAKKSISAFKVREGMPVGCKVVLRGQKMYDFIDRVIHIALPRSRDFRGIDLKAVDQNGNLTIAVKEHIVFPEVSPEKAKNIFGLEFTIVTTAKTKEEAIEFLRLIGLPLKEDNKEE